MGGALGSDQGTSYNYAISERQTGSSIKPLVNVAPGLEEKVITASTVFDDTPTTFKGRYSPKNAGGYQGLCTVRKAIEVSSNIVNIKIAYNVGINKAIEYLHEFGLTTYTEEDDAVMSLAIGGAHHGSIADVLSDCRQGFSGCTLCTLPDYSVGYPYSVLRT